MHTLDGCRKYVAAGLAVLAALASGGMAHAGVTILHSFTGAGGSDGYLPFAGLIRDAAGNLYGTTQAGGRIDCSPDQGCGTVFRLAPDGTETVLHAFAGGNDGAFPYAGLIEDNAGNFFGTTTENGAGGGGTVFKLALDGTETVLHAFAGGSDGANPRDLIQDEAGNLYGTTYGGGGGGCNGGCGTVFKVTLDGTETVLHAFTGGKNGANPAAGLIRDKAGNLYGTTTEGGTGCYGYGCGTVFKVAPNGTETVLHAFTENDGANPQASLIQDKAGNLYGTTFRGGSPAFCPEGLGCGTVFKLAPDGAETVLYRFTGKNGDGADPAAGLIQDKAGNLYGTTLRGGGFFTGSGTVFKLAPDGTETVLHAFSGHANGDGDTPEAGLIQGADGQLYGTTAEGGSACGPIGCGTVFRLKK